VSRGHTARAGSLNANGESARSIDPLGSLQHSNIFNSHSNNPFSIRSRLRCWIHRSCPFELPSDRHFRAEYPLRLIPKSGLSSFDFHDLRNNLRTLAMPLPTLASRGGSSAGARSPGQCRSFARQRNPSLPVCRRVRRPGPAPAVLDQSAFGSPGPAGGPLQ